MKALSTSQRKWRRTGNACPRSKRIESAIHGPQLLPGGEWLSFTAWRPAPEADSMGPESEAFVQSD